MPAEVSSKTAPVAPTDSRDIQLLTFKLDEQEYALNVANVVQVIRMVSITHISQAPDYVEGMFNLRGTIIPVIDTRKQCGLPPKPCDQNTQLVITRSNDHMIALAVDAISDVLTIPISNVEVPAKTRVESEHLQAIGKLGDRLLLILDPNTLIAEVETAPGGNQHSPVTQI